MQKGIIVIELYIGFRPVAFMGPHNGSEAGKLHPAQQQLFVSPEMKQGGVPADVTGVQPVSAHSKRQS